MAFSQIPCFWIFQSNEATLKLLIKIQFAWPRTKALFRLA